MAEKLRLPEGVRSDLGEAAHYLSAVQMIVSGVLAVEGDGLGPNSLNTVWWLATKGEESLDHALRAIDARAGTVEGGRADG